MMLGAACALLTFGDVGHAQGRQSPDAATFLASPAALCVDAIRTAERRYGLPSGLLLAISKVESGRIDAYTQQLQPWPWTVQAEDRSLYFDTKSAAVTWVRDALARGVTSIDTGCLQINLAFHPDAFATPDAAFDPQRNADYAARFLLQLHADSGDWRKATGSYHSQTLTLAEPYEAQVEKRLGQTGSGWTTLSKRTTVLSQLAAAWRLTEAMGAQQSTKPAGNDWSILLHGPLESPKTRAVAAQSAYRLRHSSEFASAH
jgi:hypothetical protein